MFVVDDLLPSDIEVIVRDSYHVSPTYITALSAVLMHVHIHNRMSSLLGSWVWSGPS